MRMLQNETFILQHPHLCVRIGFRVFWKYLLEEWDRIIYNEM